MAVVASVHVADIGRTASLGFVARRPRPGSIDGLRHAEVAMAAPLSASVLPKPTLGRVVMIGFWEGDDAVDAFLRDHPLAARLAGGWHARLEPLRAFGTWPGLPDDLPNSRSTDHAGAALVLTLGRLRLTQARRFLRTSARAEGAARRATGMAWGTAMARPPFVATCSLWQDTTSLSTYAYGHNEPAHADAIDTDRAKPFHHRSAFVRFRPYRLHGRLDGLQLPEEVDQ
jgi:hypothetical protein